MTASGPFIVKQLRPTVGYDVTAGAEPIVERGARVVSVQAFETLVKARREAEAIKRESPDATVTVKPTTGQALYWATPAESRPMPDDSLEQRLSVIVTAFNAAMAERYGTEGRR